MSRTAFAALAALAGLSGLVALAMFAPPVEERPAPPAEDEYGVRLVHA